MARYVGSGQGCVLHFDFIVDGELVTPTSASYTLTKNDGTVIGSSNTAITIPENSSSVNISVSGANNTKTLDNEIRYMDVSFVYKTQTFTLHDFYFLADSVKFPLSPADVRAVLGVTEEEAPDYSIDILGAYASVTEDVGNDLSGILTGGTSLLPALIEAVKYKTAGGMVSGIQSSMMQSEQADNTLYKRFTSIDFAAIAADIAGRYSAALRKLNGVSTPASPILSILSGNATDYVTGS